MPLQGTIASTVFTKRIIFTKRNLVLRQLSISKHKGTYCELTFFVNRVLDPSRTFSLPVAPKDPFYGLKRTRL